MKKRKPIRGLYAIADTEYLTETQLIAAVTQAIIGGACVVQYRDKSQDQTRRLRQVNQLARLCFEYDVLFIVNDDVELARAVRAHGVHLGRNDTPLAQARQRLGPDAIIGMSCYNELERARAAVAASADYVAFGSFFPSRTKPEAVQATPELLRNARTVLETPIVAIGGITPENGLGLIEAGADALAIITGLFAHPDIRAAAERYATLFTHRYHQIHESQN